jgi:dTDP-4-amino-4,6-dideoxygalactose transaminase
VSVLAIHGGKKVREKLFPAYRVIGGEEKKRVMKVLDSGVLSRYLGSWHRDFYGGPEVQELEKTWAERFGAKHAVSVNSCTSGLYCAVGAASLGPGDEVIVSPYTMSASATAPLIFNAIPVFADVEPDCFCLDPASVEQCITSQTKAIIVVDIFGQPYDVEKINDIARRHNLIVIEDAAQAPGASFRGKSAGTLGHIGVYSLNYHKHIHTGEGGLVTTDDDDLAERVRLIRNHAEAVVGPKGVTNLVNMIGFNFRMTEIEAAIANCQLDKLDDLVEKRLENVHYLDQKLAQIPALTPPAVRPEATHVYYVHAFKYNTELAGVSRDVFLEAVRAELAPTELREAEGVQIWGGYARPLYLQPLYQKLIAYGENGCPFTCHSSRNRADYRPGICPTVERLYEKELFMHELMRPPATKADLDDVVRSFEKVWENRRELIPQNVSQDVSVD